MVTFKEILFLTLMLTFSEPASTISVRDTPKLFRTMSSPNL